LTEREYASPWLARKLRPLRREKKKGRRAIPSRRKRRSHSSRGKGGSSPGRGEGGRGGARSFRKQRGGREREVCVHAFNQESPTSDVGRTEKDMEKRTPKAGEFSLQGGEKGVTHWKRGGGRATQR